MKNNSSGARQRAVSASHVSNYFLASEILEMLQEMRKEQMKKIVKQV